MRIQKCWFCSSNIYSGRGVNFVRNDCTIFRFCRSKCFKLFKRRVNPRKVKWTRISRQARNKELTNDPVLGFEKRVHRPAIYSREILKETLETLPKILALRKKREDMFITDRILSAHEAQKERDVNFIKKYERLLCREEPREVVLPTSKLAMKKKEPEAELN